MNKCFYYKCNEEATQIHENGQQGCDKHIIELYRENDINKVLSKNTKWMHEQGIKVNSLEWKRRSIEVATKCMGGKPKIAFMWEVQTGGVWNAIKSMIAYYLLT